MEGGGQVPAELRREATAERGVLVGPVVIGGQQLDCASGLRPELGRDPGLWGSGSHSNGQVAGSGGGGQGFRPLAALSPAAFAWESGLAVDLTSVDHQESDWYQDYAFRMLLHHLVLKSCLSLYLQSTASLGKFLCLQLGIE